MERSNILGGNERKTCFEHKAKHCPFAFGAKTGRLQNKGFHPPHSYNLPVSKEGVFP